MNALGISVCLFVLVGLVYSETCTTVSDCSHTLCDSTSDLACNANGICECILKGQTCTTKDDCLALTDWFCPDRLRHCYDGLCRCTFVPNY